MICLNHNLVIFAGAGVSTERKNLLPSTLYEEIFDELENAREGISFSTLMSDFCKNNEGRFGLINRILERIEYVRSFPELYRNTIIFHRYLAKIPCITEIITTNWDDFYSLLAKI